MGHYWARGLAVEGLAQGSLGVLPRVAQLVSCGAWLLGQARRLHSLGSASECHMLSACLYSIPYPSLPSRPHTFPANSVEFLSHDLS